MKVCDLEGAQLDYWVAKAEGIPVDMEGGDCWHASAPGETVDGADFYCPSSEWALAGPIIERERINVECWPDSNQPSSERTVFWAATRWGLEPRPDVHAEGPTPLIAAMRCFVASKFGDEVSE